MSAMPELAQLESQLEDRLGLLIDTTSKEIEQLGRTRRALDQRISTLVRKRNLWQATLETLSPNAEGTPRRIRQLRLVVAGDDYPTKPNAVGALLAEYPDREFRLIEIRQALIERGWMADDSRSAHALEVAVRMMESRGEIKRPKRGHYMLVSAED